MQTMTRDRAAVLADLAEKRHQAGRMTIVDPGYGPLHKEINNLLGELEAL